MAEDEKEELDPIKEYEDRHRKYKASTTSLKTNLNKMYFDVLKELDMLDEDDNIIPEKYDKLSEQDTLDKIGELISKKITDQAIKNIGLDPKDFDDEYNRDAILYNFYNTTQEELNNRIKNLDNYEHPQHENLVKEIMKQHEESLKPIQYARLSNEHIDDVLKYTGLSKDIDKSKVQIQHLHPFLDIYSEYGKIEDSHLKQITSRIGDSFLTEKGKKRVESIGKKSKDKTA